MQQAEAAPLLCRFDLNSWSIVVLRITHTLSIIAARPFLNPSEAGRNFNHLN
jgi:hypothetical protein